MITSKYSQTILFKKIVLFFALFYIIGKSSGKATNYDNKLFPVMLGLCILIFILDFKQRWNLKNQVSNESLKVNGQPIQHHKKAWVVGMIALYLSVI